MFTLFAPFLTPERTRHARLNALRHMLDARTSLHANPTPTNMTGCAHVPCLPSQIMRETTAGTIDAAEAGQAPFVPKPRPIHRRSSTAVSFRVGSGAFKALNVPITASANAISRSCALELHALLPSPSSWDGLSQEYTTNRASPQVFSDTR